MSLLKYISSYSASALRASLDPRGNILAPRQSRLSIGIWTVSFQSSIMSRQENGRKIQNINLESGGQTLKEMRIIENLVKTDKMCQTAGSSTIYRQIAESCTFKRKVNQLKDIEEDQNLITHKGVLQFSIETYSFSIQ